MSPKYSEDLFISFNWISHLSFANSNIISYCIYAWLVYFKALSRYSKCLYIDCFLLTYWLKPNCAFSSDQIFVILSQSQVFNSNNQYRVNNNNHFTRKKIEKVRNIGFSIKAVVIYTRKKECYYCQNNYWSNKLLSVRLDQYII